MKTAKLPHPWNEYSITSDGRVFNRYGRELKQHMSKGTVIVDTNINYKRAILYVAKAVYETFGAEQQAVTRKIRHRDGNPWNNDISNLAAIPWTRTAETVQEYEKWAISSVKRYVAERALNSIRGFDVDNFIGDALLLLWKNLGMYKAGNKFVTWAWKYCELAFKESYKKYKIRVTHEQRLVEDKGVQKQ